MEDKLLEFAAKALNMDQEEIKETLTQDGGLQELLNKDSKRIKDQKDSGYKAAERKVNGDWELKLKERFNVQSDAKGEDLLHEVLTAVETTKKAPEKLSDEQVKKHPLFIKLENEVQSISEAKETEFRKMLSEKEEAWQQEKLFGEVEKNAIGIFESLKPILSPDPQKAQMQRNILVNELKGYRYQKDGDQVIVLDSEGNRVENEQGHRVRFEDIVKSKASLYFDFQAAEERTSTANKETPQQHSVNVPKNEEDLIKLMSDTSIPVAERRAAADAYHASAQ